MSSAIAGLEPQPLWRSFAELSRIPRGSKNEEAVASFVMAAAERLGLAASRDAAGNVIVKVPATPGRENSRTVCLQGHLDMVCEKNRDTAHDFTKDPIQLIRDGNILKATGTTLGADNGIGVAAGMALMEERGVEHGPLELLFTIDEETGLTGASNLSAESLAARTMLNLDSEEEGSLYVGCAGGKDTTAIFPIELEPAPAGSATVELTVKGLKGGHSGLDIDKGRGNAIKILDRLLFRLAELGGRLSSLQGGSKRNAIPREAGAVVVVPKAKLPEVEAAVKALEAEVQGELRTTDAGVAIECVVLKKKVKVLKKAQQKKLLLCLAALPHGVIRMSADLPGLVETSTNVAVVETRKKEIFVATSQRSSVATEKDDIVATVRACFALAGAEVTSSDGYPGWKPNMDSQVLKLARAAFPAVYGRDPAVKAIHAGLECGIIGEKIPGIDMISFGPTIEGAHSPDERVHTDTVERFWKYLCELLKRID
jgi:dipeptidase D